MFVFLIAYVECRTRSLSAMWASGHESGMLDHGCAAVVVEKTAIRLSKMDKSSVLGSLMLGPPFVALKPTTECDGETSMAGWLVIEPLTELANVT